MDFLTRAELFAEDRGDGERFLRYYEYYRQKHGVRYSVRLALAWMYGDDVAEKLRVMPEDSSTYNGLPLSH